MKSASSQTAIQIDKVSISIGDYAEQLSQSLRSLDAIQVKDPQIIKLSKSNLTSRLIMETLLEDFGVKNNIQVTETELNERVELIKSGFPDDLTFLEQLKTQNQTLAQWKKTMQRSLFLEKSKKQILSSLDRTQLISEAALKQEFESRPRKEKNEKFYVRQILVTDLVQAEELKKKANTKKFSELAQTYSIAPEAKNGGLVGWVERGDFPAFDEAIKLPLNRVSAPIRSDFGFHLVLVEKKTSSSSLTFADQREELITDLIARSEQGVFTNWLDQSIKKHKILINQEAIDALTVDIKGIK